MRIKKPNIDEIKQYKREQLQTQIRDIYSQEEEFRLTNLGIKNPTDSEYLKYRETIDLLVLNYKQEAGEIYERANRD
jgi:predicted nuclease of predicted toxin-antitoxin system